MKLAIMQPYFFPYIGYFQLLHASDKFIIYDDVNYIKRGWVNRNFFLSNGKRVMQTIPLKKASQNKKINEVYVNEEEITKWQEKFFKMLKHSYSKAPCFQPTMQLIEDIFKLINTPPISIATFNLKAIKKISDHLKIDTQIFRASETYQNKNLKGQDRILDICLKENASIYINPIGGTELYSNKIFEEYNIDLFFLNSYKTISYKQFNQDFTPWLSIIDVMMFNSLEEIKLLLSRYKLLKKKTLRNFKEDNGT